MTNSPPPGLSDAQVLIGAEQALARGQFHMAEQACSKVLARNPGSSRANFLLGVNYLRQGRLDAAVESLTRALQIFPDDVNAIAALGHAHAARGEHALAEPLFRSAVARTQGKAELIRAHVISLMHLGRFEEALTSLDRLLLNNRKDSDLFNKRGYCLQMLGRQTDAIGNFSRALLLQPEFPEALNNRGNSLKLLNRHHEAIADYELASAQRPDYLLPYSNKSLSLLHLDLAQEALEACNRALELNPNFVDALGNKGHVLQKIGHYEESIAWFERALAINPAHLSSLNNIAHSLHQLTRLDEAARCYDKLEQLRPGHAETIWNRGLLKLLRGDMPSGWSDMEWRWKCKEFENKPGQRGTPEWRGEDLSGKSIAVFCEQGFGDVIQFCRYLPLLADRGAKVVLVVSPVIRRLLSTLDPRITIVGSGLYIADADFQCTLLSLPDRFATTLATIPARVPYLAAEADLVGKWKPVLASDKLKIGISWQGNPSGAVDFGRSLPLSALRPLSRIEGVQLISLQFQHGLDQLQKLAKPMKIRTLDGFNAGADGFVDTAAVMKNLDLVITSDSAPAHLAGALGVPVWTILKQVPDWRWLMDRSDSPWYPTMRLFRQHKRGDWKGVVADVCAALTELQAGRTQAGR